MNVYLSGTTFLFGLGLFILAYLLLSGVYAGLGWLVTGRRRRIASLLGATSRRAAPYRATQDDLLGLRKLPWLQIYALSLLAGLGLYLFTRQMVVLLLAVSPFAVRAWLANYRKRQLNAETLAFLMDVRIALPLQGSLLRALQEVARRSGMRPSTGLRRERSGERSGQSLAVVTARYLAGGFQGNGLELLERLAQDTAIPSLQDLVAWMQASEEGTLASDVPFEHALVRLRREMVTAKREHMQRIPTRLTILVLPALLGPTIVLLLYPVVARLLANMSGMGWGGGF